MEREVLNCCGLQLVCVLGEGLLGHLVCEIRVDLAYVSLVFYLWYKGRLDFSREELSPVNVGEEGVILDLIDIQALLRITLQETS